MGMKTELYNDNFQNFKKYNIPKAQLVIADIPYNLGVNAYAVVIDPCAGSGTTLRAAQELGRSSYGFEVSKAFYRDAVEKMLTPNRDENQIGFEEIMAV